MASVFGMNAIEFSKDGDMALDTQLKYMCKHSHSPWHGRRRRRKQIANS
jgi:hypothetical protein